MGKKSSRITAKAGGKCVKKAAEKGVSAPPPVAQRNRGQLLLRWLSFELQLLQRLVYRVGFADVHVACGLPSCLSLIVTQNKNQHRSSAFMTAVCTSIRSLKRFIKLLDLRKPPAVLSKLHLDDEFNRVFYQTLRSVLDASVEISRVHAHHFHVPLIAVLLSVYGYVRYRLQRETVHGVLSPCLFCHYLRCDMYVCECYVGVHV
ncbi:hypothetical protein BBBOND_0206650 [Babesia bigemina]|uniref:Uncharacterized protein n=1 Tax=Babesia bigemina TaxID=5866 RepID=A0A061D664_BABBI|nr:hypothetical protein BBBOND_0206650 [Babesia bigemina]CDR95507.1 hypothetical protein BBBOND_0206650 [Babesia bigemina]|eukprot:XP_012767693.1 hypothetical protein BBBOND_0206650 [Babesia bigemina]